MEFFQLKQKKRHCFLTQDIREIEKASSTSRIVCVKEKEGRKRRRRR